jgi:hypothetical protein
LRVSVVNKKGAGGGAIPEDILSLEGVVGGEGEGLEGFSWLKNNKFVSSRNSSIKYLER